MDILKYIYSLSFVLWTMNKETAVQSQPGLSQPQFLKEMIVLSSLTQLSFKFKFSITGLLFWEVKKFF